MSEQFNQSGSKYLRKIITTENSCVDVYAVLLAFNVTCPARQHAIKKLLCCGIRGKGSVSQDLREARDAVDRAIQLERCGNTQFQPESIGIAGDVHNGQANSLVNLSPHFRQGEI